MVVKCLTVLGHILCDEMHPPEKNVTKLAKFELKIFTFHENVFIPRLIESFPKNKLCA